MLIKPVLPFVEIMVTQACNISCAGCTNYSDLPHSGYLTWDQGRAQIEPWLERVDIPDFGILGGEPLMNPKIRDWIRGLRELMPTSQIRFTTNGLLLERNFDIVDLLADIGNCVFKIAVHENNDALENIIQRVQDRFTWEPVVEYGVSRLKTKNNMRFHVRRPDKFYKTFIGTYENMKPHDNDPNEAFDVCCQQTCPLLYNGSIYKCSTSGLLKDTLLKFNNPNIEQWSQYLIDGLSPDCTVAELSEFLNNFGKPNKLCRMCPTKNDLESVLIHLDNVSRKKYDSKNF
jgi:organic radical activating enzyme